MNSRSDNGGIPFERLTGFDRLLKLEQERLAPYAGLSARSRGRRRPEQDDPLRTPYQRDRDRVVHCRAFRRLLGKTQVFLSNTGDDYRVRLTHSLEVAQIARSLSRSLSLNEDLTEVLALAHDLGHPPFGHSGGDVLDRLMEDHGGFEHNRQALRIVDHLETPYPEGRGLNLSYEVRESILKHKRPFTRPEYAAYHPDESPLLEAQVVDYADGIAYNAHDLDDGLRSGILDPHEVDELAMWQLAEERAQIRFGKLDPATRRPRIVASLIDLQVKDLLEATARQLEEDEIHTLEDVRSAKRNLVGFSEMLAQPEVELRRFLHREFYTHHKVARMRHRGDVIISGLFGALIQTPRMMPPGYRALADEDGLERAVCDYIAGMTDRFAQREYGILFLPVEGRLLP